MERPYHSIGDFYKNKFGQKVFKIPVSISDDCPNRRGFKGMEVCIFCDEWGSAARKESLDMELVDQISTFKDRIAKARNAKKFLIYFQAYTSTFLNMDFLRQHFQEASTFDESIMGFVIGTRPDCLSMSTLKMWKQLCEEGRYVAVELGAQSFFDRDLEFLKRGHSAEQTVRAIFKLKELHPNIQVGVHFIFGLPGETLESVIAQAEFVSRLPIDDVKLHHLHVLANTPLETLYRGGDFVPVSLEDYGERVKAFLSHLSPRLAVHRLAAQSPRRDELIAPDWTADKMRVHQHLVDALKGSPQGSMFKRDSKVFFAEEKCLALEELKRLNSKF